MSRLNQAVNACQVLENTYPLKMAKGTGRILCTYVISSVNKNGNSTNRNTMLCRKKYLVMFIFYMCKLNASRKLVGEPLCQALFAVV